MADDRTSEPAPARTESDMVEILGLLAGTTLVGFLILGSVFAAPVVLWIGYQLYEVHAFQERTPIVQGPQGQTEMEAERAFADHVAQRFGIGTAAGRIQDELSGQGFEATRSFGGFEHALRTGIAMFPCRSTWTVSWKVDAVGRITAIEGQKEQVCL